MDSRGLSAETLDQRERRRRHELEGLIEALRSEEMMVGSEAPDAGLRRLDVGERKLDALQELRELNRRTSSRLRLQRAARYAGPAGLARRVCDGARRWRLG